MQKVILTNTKEEAQAIIDQVNLLLGLPNLETGTMTFAEPILHKNEQQWIAYVPDDIEERIPNIGTITEINPDTDVFRLSFEMHSIACALREAQQGIFPED